MTATAAEVVLEEQTRWSQAADRAKARLVKWRAWQLVLTVLGAAVSAIGAQWGGGMGQVLAGVSAACLAAAPVVTARLLNADRLLAWTRSRVVSEQLKSELYRYLARVGPYGADDRDEVLLAQRDAAVAEGAEHEMWLRPVEGTRSLPPVHDVPSYLEHRVRRAIEGYYEPAVARERLRFDRLHTAELLLSALAVVLGAIAAAVGLGVASWIAVATTVSTALAAHLAAGRHLELSETYSRTTRRLRSHYDRARVAGAADPDELVRECETIILAENRTWTGLWQPDDRQPGQGGQPAR